MILYVIYREIDGNIFPPEAVRLTEDGALAYIKEKTDDLNLKVKHLQSLLGPLNFRFLYKEMEIL